jgi:hypothetical protein
MPVHPSRYASAPITVCQRTHHGMPAHPSWCACSPILVCLLTHLGMPAHPSRYASAPISVCQRTHLGVPAHPSRCACSPILVCHHTHLGFLKSDLGFENASSSRGLVETMCPLAETALPHFAVFPLLGTLARQGQPVAIADPSTEGLSVFVIQLQPDVFPDQRRNLTTSCLPSPLLSKLNEKALKLV